MRSSPHSMRHAFAAGLAAILAVFVTSVVLAGGGVKKPSDGNSGNPGVFPLGSNPYGTSYEEWSARWWQWAYSIPASGNPLFDETGALCGAGQSGPVWFLAGIFNVTGSATRDQCTVPAGKAIFFPIINVEWDNKCPPDVLTPEQLRAKAAEVASSATDLACELDGRSIGNLPSYRTISPLFSVTFPNDNIFQAFGCDVPAGTYSPFAGDGYYVMLAPPAPGPHTLHFHGALPLFNFALDITYHFTVAAGGAGSTVSTDPAGLGTELAPPPAFATWGRLKATYR